MNWDELTDARAKLAEKGGYKNNLTNFELLIGAGPNVPAANWKPRGIPLYIQHSIEAHLIVAKSVLKEIAKERGITLKAA